MDLIRADLLLTQRTIVRSRSEAADLIRRGLVIVNGKPVSKPGTLIPRASSISVDCNRSPFVSRGGEKLAGALHAFHVDPTGRVAMDCGASTGGFTDCLLKNGALKVYAIDVGYGQLDWKLRNDPRVIVIERTNFRSMPNSLIKDSIGVITMDLSFISLKLVLPKACEFMDMHGIVIPLVKPQFEAGKGQIGSGGVIRDRQQHLQILTDLAFYASENGWCLLGITPSPLLGPKGNREFFFHMKRGEATKPETITQWIEAAVSIPGK